jgi:hypothetical protein
MPAGLLLVPPLRLGLAANRLPVRHLGRLQRDLGVIPPLQPRDDRLNMLLPRARDQKLIRLGSRKKRTS